MIFSSFNKKVLIIFTILLICFIVLRYDYNFNRYIRYYHTEQTCDTFAQAVHKFNLFELEPLESLHDLQGKYITSGFVDSFRDDWNNPFHANTEKGIIFSSGPDQKAYTVDDISCSYTHNDFTITNTLIDYNPENLIDSSAKYDILHIFFNKDVKLSPNIKLNITNSISSDSINLFKY